MIINFFIIFLIKLSTRNNKDLHDFLEMDFDDFVN